MNNPALKLKFYIKKFIALSIILLSNPAFTQTMIDDLNHLKSPSNILRFADYLFCEKDYLRAIDEYKSYLSKVDNDTVKFKIGLSYSGMADYRQANEIFINTKWNKKLGKSAEDETAKNYFLEKKFVILDSINNSLCSGEAKNLITASTRLFHFSKLYGNELENDRWLLDKQKYLSVFSGEAKEIINQIYDEGTSLPYRSPTVAAVLSAIIPGAGKIYSSQYTDGFTSLLVTGLLSYLSYDNFQAKHKFRGWLFGGLATYFYAGNIYGSAAAAQIYNAEVSFNFHLKLDSFIKKQNYFIPEYDFICN
ncbi:MAG: hypothetical protein C4539_05755 [Ignavibacteriales bacterium]|nr:MAG: hypothetical protein C4539_05755 [Ignavibacteriales bacterium]